MSNSRAIHLTTSAKSGTTVVTAVGSAVDTDELGIDLRTLDFVAGPAGIALAAESEAVDAAVELLRAWGYDVVLEGGV